MVVARAALALFAVGGWMTLLFSGQVWGGGVHLILAAALAVFPWRAARGPTAAAGEDSRADRPPGDAGT